MTLEQAKKVVQEFAARRPMKGIGRPVKEKVIVYEDDCSNYYIGVTDGGKWVELISEPYKSIQDAWFGAAKEIQDKNSTRFDNPDRVGVFNNLVSAQLYDELLASQKELINSLNALQVWAATIASVYPGHRRQGTTVEKDIETAKIAIRNAMSKA